MFYKYLQVFFMYLQENILENLNKNCMKLMKVIHVLKLTYYFFN